ncbi:MAG: deoxyguanosinetriphosphate triphosphohydrolase [Deltaproteobacteria bacterium]|nr:deoxyguanosinetriphosphate triphosphohydrolase [Deltaproteobacteria bacterium]MBW2020605.1 deoxyguanosinetriphosphate triphosphohydrolase [Deltaproteobacteria bacterium]MBW2075492.1 deoxyguanosinetriphosphate triphosphohydrolase [Deltaproteobacteria bacterium]
MKIRERLEQEEKRTLSPFAALSAETKGRLIPEEPCDIRTAFQRDRDRIIHSKSFRRLKHKTQVFLSPTGDHYRTRLTHTLEVAQIARTVAKALQLNEVLTEAIALGHDLGHTPFGHAGEAVLNEIFPAGFSHHKQSLRVVDVLEKNGRGLNLTAEVRDGILKHSKGKEEILPGDPASLPATLEARVVRVCDIIAYVNHDVDDAIRGGIIVDGDIPRICLEVLGDSHVRRIDTMVKDLIFATLEGSALELRMHHTTYEALVTLRDFLYERVYEIHTVHDDFVRAKKIIYELYDRLLEDEAVFRQQIGDIPAGVSKEQTVCDFIAGMTDRYALHLYEKIFMPKPWMVY